MDDEAKQLLREIRDLLAASEARADAAELERQAKLVGSGKVKKLAFRFVLLPFLFAWIIFLLLVNLRSSGW